jgi:hypothetical protein
MHETFICLAEMGRVLALADLVGHHEAHVSLRLQIPGVIKGRRRAGRLAVPADTGVGHELIDPALERQAEGRPVKHRAVLEDVAAVDANIF